MEDFALYGVSMTQKYLGCLLALVCLSLHGMFFLSSVELPSGNQRSEAAGDDPGWFCWLCCFARVSRVGAENPPQREWGAGKQSRGNSWHTTAAVVTAAGHSHSVDWGCPRIFHWFLSAYLQPEKSGLAFFQLHFSRAKADFLLTAAKAWDRVCSQCQRVAHRSWVLSTEGNLCGQLRASEGFGLWISTVWNCTGSGCRLISAGSQGTWIYHTTLDFVIVIMKTTPQRP